MTATRHNAFNSALEKELTMSETVRSENGALMHASTGKSFLDAFWKISSCRNITNEDEIIQIFAPCFKENFELACRLLFYIRDCRQGCGEKRTFQILFNWLLNKNVEMAAKLVKLIPEYGSWKDVVILAGKFDNPVIFNVIRDQLNKDLDAFGDHKPISLLAKWLPSINTSSKKTVDLARLFCKRLDYTHSTYRRVLSQLRKHIDVIERKMCSGEWSAIDYNAVPSKANLLYKNAFLKHDEERRKAYLTNLKAGNPDVKINAGVLEPYEIVHKYISENGHSNNFSWTGYRSIENVDDATELLWKNLPRNDALQEKNLICVHDNSGSMGSLISGTSITAHDVADSLAIYCSELLKGDWKDKFITFSEQPKMIDLSNCDTLASKIGVLHRKMDCSNTNIAAVFNLVLKTAVENHCKQEEIPEVLVLSDMEFDYATDGCVNDTLFETIRKKFANYGYQMPKMIFWNICSRTMGIPVRENSNGVILVSGFSKNIFKMVASGKLDPFEALKEQLNAKRYDAVEEALNKEVEETPMW
jgi:hypothetical protein